MGFLYIIVQLICALIICLISYKYIFTKNSYAGFKRLVAKIYIKHIKKSHGQIDWLKNGWNLEQPTIINNPENFDSLTFYAYDVEGNTILTRITKQHTDITEIWLQIRLKDDQIYQLPDNPSTSINCKNTQKWSAHGLDFCILEPFKRIRITFNGLLRKCTQDGCNEDVVHVKFNFIWSSCSAPKHWPLDQSTNLLSKTINQKLSNEQNWTNILINTPVYGHDQYGALYGELYLPNGRHELNLPSLRKRRMGLLNHEKYYVDFMGVFKDGTLYNIGVLSTAHFETHEFGTIRMPDGDILSITDSDISKLKISGTIVDDEKLKLQRILNFQAGSEKFQLFVNILMDDLSILYGGNPWNFTYNIMQMECKLNDENYGVGLSIEGRTGSDGNCDGPLLKPKHYLVFSDIHDHKDYNKRIVHFDEIDCRSVGIVGGKGASLGLLHTSINSEFTVPLGFCITSKAFKNHIESYPNVLALIEDLISKKNDLKYLENYCEKIQNLIAEIPMADDLLNSLKVSLERLRIQTNVPYSDEKSLKFAVRSSSLLEDGAESSAAGQYDTILGCLTDDDIKNAIIKCWGSMFSFRSIMYRIQHGQPINCGMGVVIQIMVPSEIAGVMFTCHSTTNDPSKILITASYGLGESVVSSLVSPDEFVINRTWDNQISVHSSTIGEKSVSIEMTDCFIETKNLSIEKSTSICLTNEEVLRIAKIGIHLQNLYDHHCDIEWAYYQNKIYVLQSRAITTINGVTDFELLHEFDTPLLTNNELISFSNVGEGMPLPLSTLGLSIISPYANKVSDSHKSSSYLRNLYEYFYISFPVYNHRLTLNILGKFLEDVDANKISIMNRVVSLAVTGKDVLNELLHKTAVHRFKPSLFKKLKYVCRIFRILWINKRVKARAEQIESTYRIHEDYDKFKNCELLFDFIEKHHSIIGEIFQCHNDSSFASIFYKVISTVILMENNEEFSSAYLQDISILLSINNEALSADVPMRLEEIAQIISKSDKLNEFHNLKSDIIDEWLKLNIPDAFHKFEDLLKEHGHRGIMEFDVASDPWILNPKPLLDSLMVTTKSYQSRKIKNINVTEILTNLKTPKRFWTKLLLRILLPKISASVCIREYTKSISILCFHRLRLGYRKLGKMLEAEGRLPDAHLINHLHPVEIRKLIFNNETHFIQKAIKRQKLQEQWRQLTYDEFFYGRPVPLESNDDETNINGLNDDSEILVIGTPVYPGYIKGRACVIKSVADAHLIQSNDILITTATDIGWSPYFPMISGIVTELGGLISHGAVIAREYGIPCIIGAKNATKKISTGDEIILNATKGQILQILRQNKI